MNFKLLGVRFTLYCIQYIGTKISQVRELFSKGASENISRIFDQSKRSYYRLEH